MMLLLFTVLAINFIGVCAGRGFSWGLCNDYEDECICGNPGTKIIMRIEMCTTFLRLYCHPCDGYIVNPKSWCPKFLNCAECHSDGGDFHCTSCPPLKYGKWCEANCDCRNGASCDMEGKCICAEDYEGDVCERRKAPKCPLLRAPANASLAYSKSDLVEGVTAAVHCYQHHRLIGESKVTCLPGGVWSSVLPVCEQLPVCSDPGLASYSIRQARSPGTSQFGPFYEGMTLRYTCAKGFEQIGSSTITCLAEGIWSDEPPICVKSCVPPQPATPPLQENLYPPENPLTITYSCPPEHEMRGNAIATCLRNGQWSSSPPQCFRKCPLLSAPANGRLEYSKSDLVEGVTAVLHCHQHHRLIGGSKVKCLSGGVWSSVLPICKQLAICSDPGLSPYSSRQAGSRGKSRFGPFYEGMTLRYTCAKGFEKIGGSSITCLAEGIWSDEPPICVKVSRTVASCETKASDVIQGSGVPVRLYCPPECTERSPDVWGTAIYSIDSTICPAAVHAGMITNSGGLVEVISNGMYPSFVSSNLNKIQSKSLDEQLESFRFNKLPTPAVQKENGACQKGLVKMGNACMYIPDKLKTKDEADAVCTNLGLSLEFPEFEEDEKNITTLLKGKGINQVWANKNSVPQENFSNSNEDVNKNVSDVVGLPKLKCGIITISSNDTTKDLAECDLKMNFICFQDLSSEALAVCDEPDPLSNGQATPIGMINGIFYVGSSIEYTCDPLHYMKGTPQVSCTGNGTWSGETPKCIQVNTCDEPLVPIGGLVEYLLPTRESQLQRKVFMHSVSVSRISRMPIGLGANLPEDPNELSTTAEPETEDIELPKGKRKIGTRAVYECESRYYELVGSRIRRCKTGGRWSGRPSTCIPKCGQSDSPRTPFIVNGNATDVGQWPWQAAVSKRILDSAQWFVMCGGSLLNERWIVTAAHCVTYPSSNVLINKERFRISLGRYHRQDSEDDQYVQTRRAREIHIHPDFDPSLFDSDIALIQLDSPVQFNSRTQPVCLPSERTTRENLMEGIKGVVTGWGITEKGTYSETLQQAVLPVVSAETCEEGYIKAEFPLTVTENMFCAGYARGKVDSCSGDSGSPMVFLDPRSKEKRWVLEGIVSWGSPNGCGRPDQYGGFTTVSKFLDWIQLFL